VKSVYLSGSVQEKNLTVLPGKTEESIMQDFARAVALAIQRKTDQIDIYLNDPEWTLDQVIADSNSRHPDLHIALHSNAGGGTGTETWAWPAGTNSFAFATLLQDKVVDALGLPDRGVKDGRQLKEVGNAVKATSVLIEVFFHDNESDMARFRERYAEVRDAIAEAVIEWFGAEVKADDPTANRLRKLEQFKTEVLEAVKRLEAV
jgi:N-acetylmuramoyl-L-alanine amidase